MAEQSRTSYGGNLLRAGLQGVSFGFADELEAMARAATSDRTYQQEVKDIREDIEQFRETNPVAAYGTEIAGAIPTGIGLGIGLLRAGIGTGIRGAAKLGAIEGGIYGAGEGEGVEGTIKTAAIGTGIGAVGGAAGEKVVQAATPAAKRIYGRVREALSREPESSVPRTITDIIGTEAFVDGATMNFQRFKFGALSEDELIAAHDRIQDNMDFFTQGAFLDDDMNIVEGMQDDVLERYRETLDRPGVFTDNMLLPVVTSNEGLETARTRLLREFNAVSNEMAGRRGTELEQLTPEQAALYNNQFDPFTLEDTVNEADEAAFAQQLQGDDVAAPQAQARVDLGDEAIPPMPLSLAQSTGFTPLDDGLNPPVQLGIGALDEAPGLHATDAISIGSMPDQFGGTVMHYSPVATSFEKLVLDPKGVKFSASGELSAQDYLAHFNNETKTPGGRSEIAGSELENILTTNPDEKYTIDEMRTLIQSRVPQTVERLFLEGGTGPLAPDVTEGPFSNDLPYTTAQYRSEDRALGQERGVIVYSNSVPTIDVPGYGRIRPNDRGVNHGYYDNYPGYYGHTRFQIMDDEDGRRYLWVNEIQSNAVSNLSSGTKVEGQRTFTPGEDPGPKYARNLEDRLNAYSAANRVKIPYTKEVHEKMLKLESMKPEILTRNETLTKQIKEYTDEADRLQNDPILKFTPTRELATDNNMTSLYKHGMRFINDLDGNEDVEAAIYNYLRDYRGEAGNVRSDDFLDAARDQIVASVDAQAGFGGSMSTTDIDEVTDIVLLAFDDTNGDIGQFRDRLRAYVQDSGQEYLSIGSQKIIFDSDEFMDAVDSLPEDVAAGLRQRLDEKVASHRPNMPDSGYISKTPEFRALEERAVEHFKSKLGDFYKNKFTPALEELQDEVVGETGYDQSDVFSPEFRFEDALEGVVEHVPAVFFNNQRNEVLAKLADTQAEADGIAGKALQASIDYKNAIEAEPDGTVLQQLQKVAKDAIDTGGNRGFQAPTPYATGKADSQFYEFATRSAIKQAEQLGLDGVIFPDARYLSTAPGRSENPAFQKNYGNAVDKALKGFVNSGGGNQQPRVELRNNSQDPNPINFLNPGTGDNKSQFTVRGIDPNDADAAEQLVPFQDQVKQAEARVTQLDKETKALEARLEEIKNDPNEYRVDANGNRRRIIRTGTDGNMIDSESQRVVNDISNKREELRLAVERADNQKGSLQAKKDELATDYATPLRIVNFRDPVTKEAAQRPIRRAAGGMIRSGIGSMAREVM